MHMKHALGPHALALHAISDRGVNVVETACKTHPRSENRLHGLVVLVRQHYHRVGFRALYKVYR